MTASNAYIGGTIVAGAGTIGGFTIGAHTLTTTNFTIGDSTQTYALNASNLFTVTHLGALVAQNATITGDITATTANISGSIYASEINAVTGRLQNLDIDGTITIQSGGSLVAGDATLNSTSLTISGTASSIKLGSGAF